MRIEEMNSEQIGKVNAPAADEERPAYLNELDDDLLSRVAGGADQNSENCPNGGIHNWLTTRNKKKLGGLLVSIFVYEYKCSKCGKVKWGM